MPISRARLLSIAAWGGFSAVIVGTALVFSARWFWIGEIAASFAWQLGWASLVGAALLAVTGSRRLGVAVLCVAGLHLWTELSLWMPDARAGAEQAPAGSELSIASANLLWTNTRFDGFRDWTERTEPDVVICLELSTAWRESLEGLRERYPHQLYSPAGAWTDETWGTAILSRLPFESTDLIPVPPDSRPAMECVIRIDGRAVTIRGAHPMRPGRLRRLSWRNAALDVLARQEWDDHCILLGDLNVTASSPFFDDLLDASGLRDSRSGFGRLPSFRLERLAPGLEVAIDHILVGDAFHVLERRNDEMPGSDHRTVFARLALR